MSSQNFIQGQDYKLSGSGINATQTTIPLESFNLPNGTAITATELGTINYGTLEPNACLRYLS